ncbi:winged helix-turn-helix transcriptional regulator [Bifidobacterium aquikefiricola]|uniref:Helix-turn-helix domain-containing protein n=1 Tax=Bifidobacterium aquikefiricola TaxID=3059038 RepID=A0AB39U876_9BIFI
MAHGEASVSYVRTASIACDGFLAAIDIIDRRWSSLVIQAIAKGCRTFSQISCYSNKINDSSLSKRLKELEEQGIVKRTIVDTRPPRAMYHLTQSGLELVPILDALTEWGNRNLLDQSDSSGNADS